MSFSASLQQSKKPSLLPSTSFRAASQLPRYSKFSLAMTSISSPLLSSNKRRTPSSSSISKRDLFEEEREAVVAQVTALGVAPSKDKDLVKAGFLKDGFWDPEKPEEQGVPAAAPVIVAPPSISVVPALSAPLDGGYKNAMTGVQDGGYKEGLSAPSPRNALDGGYKEALAPKEGYSFCSLSSLFFLLCSNR
jgi:hypothetical protein